MFDDIRLSRRQMLKRLALTAGGAVVYSAVPMGMAHAAGEESAGAANLAERIKENKAVFAQFGGRTTAIREKVYFNSFGESTGVEVVSPLLNFGKFIAMCKNGPQQWDAIDGDGFYTIELQRMGLLQKLPDWVERCDMVEGQWQPYISGGYAYCAQCGYLPQAFPDGGPQNWKDFWDVEKYPGKRGWPSGIYAGTLEAALMADGVAKDDLYPLDFKRAFKKLDELRPHMVFWNTYAQGQQLLMQRAISALMSANGRFHEIRRLGKPIVQVWNEAVLYPWSAMPVPKNAPHPSAIFGLISWMSNAERQAAFARHTGYGPTNSGAFKHLNDEEIANVPNSEAHRDVAATINADYLAGVDAEYFDRYRRWVAKS